MDVRLVQKAQMEKHRPIFHPLEHISSVKLYVPGKNDMQQE